MQIAPALAEILLQIFGPLPVHRADALLDVGALLQARAQAENPIAKRRVDKDMVDIRLVLQDALSAPAHNHAIAVAVGPFDDLLRDLHHLLGIEDGVLAELQAGSQRRAAHGLLIQAAQPRVNVLVVVANHRLVHVSRVGNGVDDVAIQQLPVQPPGNGLSDASPAAPELPVNRQYPVFHGHLPRSPVP